MGTQIFTTVTFLLGIITVVLSMIVALIFARRAVYFSEKRDKHFTWALALQLVGEAIIGTGTLVFAAATHFGWLAEWSGELQSVIRFIMFTATAFTTLHLYSTIIRIQDS